MDFPAAGACATSAATCLPVPISPAVCTDIDPVRPAEGTVASIGGNADPTGFFREEVVSIANFQEASR
jgi:hypothetical protein